MKKIIFAIAIVLTITLSANAQSDWFVNEFDNDTRNLDNVLPILVVGNGGQWNNDQPATSPLGSGLLILTALGAGYAIRKFRNEIK